MSDKITIRVPEDLKAMMKATNINWSEDIRSYIVARVNALKLSRVLKGIVPGSKRKGGEDSNDIVREWRDAQYKSLKLHKLLPKIYKDASRIKVKGDSSVLVKNDRESRL